MPSPWREQGANRSLRRQLFCEIHCRGSRNPRIIQGLQHLVPACNAMPPTLLLQALDDPWVPASSAMDLSEALPPEAAIRTLFTPRGGHNGFHGRDGCWGDQLAAAWLRDVVAG